MFNPKGVTGESPGQRPGFGIDLVSQALKGRNTATQGVRRDANKAIETAEKDKLISEDDRDSSKEEVQELTKKYEDEVSEVAKARESDVMEQ